MPDFVEGEGLSAENGVPDFSSPEKNFFISRIDAFHF